MAANKFRLGMIGLGTMGRNLLLNMSDHGFPVAGYDKDLSKIELLKKEGKNKNINGYESITDFIESLQIPRVIILLVPAGKIVDVVISELKPLLTHGDIIIDGGNSHFTDTMARISQLEEKGLHFFGMGISGGEEGARTGPSMMPGGDLVAYKYVQPMLEAIAAKVNKEPCVTYIGPGASGHFVKMVHNGIEYALMQLIADIYEILRTKLNLNNTEICRVFDQWNKGRLQSYLLEITADIFAYRNPDNIFLVDQIKDQAKAKGTGKWTTQVSSDIELPVPTIDVAVALRDLSKYKSLREKLNALYESKVDVEKTDKDDWLKKLENAYHFSMILIYAQGMHLLSKASVNFNYDLDLASIARIWRGGCIIRAAFLEEIYSAFKKDMELEHLLLDEDIRNLVLLSEADARMITIECTQAGISIPALASTVSYFDAIRTGKMPTNLIQAQRDYFGAHTYELIGKEGVFHTEWKTAYSKQE